MNRIDWQPNNIFMSRSLNAKSTTEALTCSGYVENIILEIDLGNGKSKSIGIDWFVNKNEPIQVNDFVKLKAPSTLHKSILNDAGISEEKSYQVLTISLIEKDVFAPENMKTSSQHQSSPKTDKMEVEKKYL